MDPLPILIGLLAAVLLLAPGLRWPTVGRLVIGLYFVGGSLFNLLVTLPDRDRMLTGLVATASIPFYRDVVRLALAWDLAGPPVVLVAAFELTVGVLSLSRGGAAGLGLLGAAAWYVGMLPVLPPDGLAIGLGVTAAPALLALLLARRDHDRDLPAIARASLRSGAGVPGGAVADAGLSGGGARTADPHEAGRAAADRRSAA